MNRKKTIQNIGLAAVIVFLILVIVYSGLQLMGATVLNRKQEQPEKTTSKTITRDGVKYFPRQDITVVMLAGVDQFGPVQDTGTSRNPGAVDVIALLVFDETNQVCNILNLNRDSMTEVQMLDDNKRPAGTFYGQIALAHAYGGGLEDSCENVRTTVSNFLYGIPIDYYITTNMDAVAIVNDAVGGVTVTVEDDFSVVDPSIQMGEMTLHGDQAIHFVRLRRDVGNQLNLSRMERQKQYIRNFLDLLREKLAANQTFSMSLYEQISDYIVTDCSATTISSMMNRYAEYPVQEIVTPEGENVLGEKFYEFYVDTEKLDELILRLFYAPKK